MTGAACTPAIATAQSKAAVAIWIAIAMHGTEISTRTASMLRMAVQRARSIASISIAANIASIMNAVIAIWVAPQVVRRAIRIPTVTVKAKVAHAARLRRWR